MTLQYPSQVNNEWIYWPSTPSHLHPTLCGGSSEVSDTQSVHMRLGPLLINFC